MNYTIEAESEKDFPEIYNLIKVAFATSEDADGDEHDYVDNLRKSPNYIPDLAFTIKVDSKIIGHIMLTKTYIIRENETLEALLLSPLCVQLEYRNQGVGGKLIEQSLNAAKEKGFKAVFLVGEPKYYSRFGFMPISNFGIEDTGDIPIQYKLAIELQNGFLANHGGKVSIY